MNEENKNDGINNENTEEVKEEKASETKQEEIVEEEKSSETKQDEIVAEEKKEEKASETKQEEIVEEEKSSETKQDEIVAEEKKEEKPSETKQEEKKEHVRLVEAKPTVKEKKSFPWKTTGIIVGAIVLSLSSGALGGYVGGKVISNQIQSELEDISQPQSGASEFGDKGGSSESFGGFGGFEMPSEESDTPALGITVQTTDESSLVIAGFADGSNGEEKGLEVGDIITKVDDKEVSSTSDIATILEDFEIGDEIKVTVTRDGKEVEATITLIQKTNTFSFQMGPSNNNKNNFPEDDSEKVQG